MCPCDTWHIIHGLCEDTWPGERRKEGETKFPLTWDKTNKIREQKQFGKNQKGGKRKIKRKKREKKRKEKKRKGGKTKVEKNQAVGERKRKMERGKEKIFPVFRWSELDSLRTKVGPRNESYTWAPKSEFFVEVPRGRGFLLHWFFFT